MMTIAVMIREENVRPTIVVKIGDERTRRRIGLGHGHVTCVESVRALPVDVGWQVPPGAAVIRGNHEVESAVPIEISHRRILGTNRRQDKAPLLIIAVF